MGQPPPVEQKLDLEVVSSRFVRRHQTVRLHIMAVDCCEHVVSALENIPSAKLTTIGSKDNARAHQMEVQPDLIVIGTPKYPVRRLFISQLRRVYANKPVLILRRIDSEANGDAYVRGEFLLSDSPDERDDLEIVRALRQILPIQPCEHVHKGRNYDIVREVLQVISENYTNPDLELGDVAKQVLMTPAQLSRVLNQQVGVSFRQVLRQTRIEEAKRMLAVREYSVKEVAAKVGFADSHYFSRSFKELTGVSAREFRAQDAVFG